MGAPQLIVPGTASGTGPVGGSGTTNTIPRWTGPSTLGDSVITQSGSNIGVGVPTPAYPFQVQTLAANTNTISLINGTGNLSRLGWVQNGSTTLAFTAIDGDGRATGYMSFLTAAVERMRITDTGNVGIGTANPLGPLDTRDATGGVGIATIYTGAITANVGGKISFGGYFTGVAPTTWASIVGGKDNNTDGNFAGHLQFLTRPSGGSQTERARIDSAGNVGIGTASPGALLDVSSGKTVGTGGFRVGADVSATTRTNNTRKIGSLSVPHYDNTASDASLMAMDANTTTNTLYVGGGWSQNAATSILFYTGATSTTTTGSERWRIATAGHLLAGADNTYDIGASGATRPRTVYVGTSVIVGPSATAAGTNANALGNTCSASATSSLAMVYNSTASAIYAVAIGNGNTASGQASVALGQSTTASAQFSMATGINSAAVRYGQLAHTGGGFAAVGDAQKSLMVALRATADATPTNLTLSGAALSSTNALSLPNNTAWAADIHVVARQSTGANHAYFVRRVLIKRDANAASTALVGTVQTIGTDIGSNAGAPPAGWAVTITADTTNGALDIQVTGALATSIRWVARVELVEVALA